VFRELYNKTVTYLTDIFGENFILLIFLLTIAVSIIYFIVISYLITQLDKGYFIRKKCHSDILTDSSNFTLINKSLTYIVKIIKIIVGLFLLLCGLVMLVLPGQGLITMLIGLILLPFPGKRKIEQSLLSRESIRTSLNWIRIKANKEPFIFD